MFLVCHALTIALLQHGANPNIRNSEQKTPLDLADDNTRPVLTGEYRKDELLEAARSGAEDRLLALLTPLNVNCHASDGRRSTPLHLAGKRIFHQLMIDLSILVPSNWSILSIFVAGYNRLNIVQILLQNGADVHAKVISCPFEKRFSFFLHIFKFKIYFPCKLQSGCRIRADWFLFTIAASVFFCLFLAFSFFFLFFQNQIHIEEPRHFN